jgi:hypothetical protein
MWTIVMHGGEMTTKISRYQESFLLRHHRPSASLMKKHQWAAIEL